MEVAVISVESIKPSSPVHHLKPFKLCLLDQLTRTSYSPLILFYPTIHAHLKRTQFLTQLKSALSKTLTPFYPLSGRVKDNYFIHNYEEGVPFIEARVKGHLSDFLQHPPMELLNQFLPCQPFCQQPNPTVAQVAVQVNMFDCGGIALGMCFSHKINDGITGSSFIKSWAANARGSAYEAINPNLSEASSLFPPQQSLPSYYISLMESLWFSRRSFRTRRFVFGANAVATLTAKGRSKFVERPTRVEGLCCFIWRCCMNACRSISGSPRASVLSQAVNIRRIAKPRLSRYSIGNLVWSAITSYNPDETEMGMQELVALVREGVGKINSEYIKKLSGEGCVAIFEHLDRLADIGSGKTDVFSFFSWHKFDFSEIDFGWGKPVWVGIFGEASRSSPCDSNFIILKDVGRNNGIEAWMTLDDNVMAMLEHDPEFLAFASLN